MTDNVCFPLLTTFVSPSQYPISFSLLFVSSWVVSHQSMFNVSRHSSFFDVPSSLHVVHHCSFLPFLVSPPPFFLIISTPVLVVVYQSYQDVHCLCFLRTSLYLSCSAVVPRLFLFFILYVLNFWPPRPYFSCIAPTCFCIFLRLLVSLYISTVAW